MSKVRYTGGSLTGVDLTITYKDGDVVQVHVPHGEEHPTEVQGRKVPDEHLKSLLEQPDNWSAGPASTKKDGEK